MSAAKPDTLRAALERCYDVLRRGLPPGHEESEAAMREAGDALAVAATPSRRNTHPDLGSQPRHLRKDCQWGGCFECEEPK